MIALSHGESMRVGFEPRNFQFSPRHVCHFIQHSRADRPPFVNHNVIAITQINYAINNRRQRKNEAFAYLATRMMKFSNLRRFSIDGRFQPKSPIKPRQC
jgi:hypothetical protein